MTRVVAYDDVKATQERGGGEVKTRFFKSSPNTPDSPMAFLSQGEPNRIIAPHFHDVDEFQIIAEGDGRFGRHCISPYCVHFARAYTPYGPLVGGAKTGVSFFTLRRHYDKGARYLPKHLDQLKGVADRQPWQITRQVKFPSQGSAALPNAVNLLEISDIKDDQGLFAYSLVMAPGARATAPDPTNGDGQFLVAIKGGLWHDNKEHRAFTVVFVEPTDGAFKLHAGAEGLEAIILNFPQTKKRSAFKTEPSAATGYKKWQCELCAFAYDEALGLPDDGIPAGTRWADVPGDWSCPDCATSKNDFRMIEA